MAEQLMVIVLVAQHRGRARDVPGAQHDVVERHQRLGNVWLSLKHVQPRAAEAALSSKRRDELGRPSGVAAWHWYCSAASLFTATILDTQADANEGATGEENLDAQADANEGAAGEENLDAQADANEDILGSGENLQPSDDTKNLYINEQSMLTIFDPRTWENLNNIKRDILIEREMDLQFPSDPSNRRFSYAYYSRKLTNGEVVGKKWLVYSKHVDKCGASDKLNIWNDLRIRLSKNKTIEDEMQQEIAKEKERWRQVLSLDLNIDDVRGQRYDNGSNMNGKHQGVQESRIKSVQPIRYQASQIRSALKEVERTCTEDPKSVSEAGSLVTTIENFEFLVGMIIWEDILSVINMVSKKLQSPIVCLDSTLKQIEGVISYFKKYRDTGLSASIETAKSIASSLDVEPTFPTKHKGKRKKQFDEQDDETEELQRSAIDDFNDDYFLVIVDYAIVLLTSRFDQLKEFEKIFGFLFNLENLKSLDHSDLRDCCTTFVNTFSHDNKSDVELDDLFSELKVLQVTLPDQLMSASEILHFVKDADCYPNASIAYRILLTIPVTVASAERSFSKLKLLKNCLRSTMLQERLNGLAMCSIEKNILDTIDLESVLEDFASRNVRRRFFKKH
ncbi:uncharacterized protein [Miscanthus floridulus]|uniref:uncharacterized protein n=1 Tax=Miscanthus floridulus TaxID=154761 RepID=UPI003459CCE0